MIKFIVDSTSCITKEYATLNDIKVVELTVELDDVRHKEGFEPEWDDFYTRLKNTKSFPKTSQPTPYDFEECFKEIIEKDKDAQIVVLTLSQSLSGTYNSALLASENYKGRVHVIDSGQTSYSQLLLLEEMVDYAKTNPNIDNFLEFADKTKQKISIHFVPTTMEYLKRGGRINLLSATIASILQIKPILVFKNGKLTSPKKPIGMQKAISEMLSEVPKALKKMYVLYIHESDLIQKFVNLVEKTFNIVVDKVHKVSPVVGSHIGIGAVGIAYIAE